MDTQDTMKPHGLKDRVVRYSELVPCYNAFVDTRTPGSEEKENFTIVGPGVSENPNQHVHIPEPHGFNIGGARQPPGCTNSQHSHETAEVFLVHSGTWAFRWGEHGDDGEVVLESGDVISIPTHVFRGFENVGEDTGFLFAVLGGDDPGRVLWAPYVFDMAKDYGLILLKSGDLVDTTVGERVPADDEAMPRTTPEQVASLDVPSFEAMRGCVAKPGEMPTVLGGLTGHGVRESAIIGFASDEEQAPAGKMAWKHGFHMRRLDCEPGATTPVHRRTGPEVLFVQKGTLSVEHGEEAVSLNPGDTYSVPVDLARRFVNKGDKPCVVYAVRGGDVPERAI